MPHSATKLSCLKRAWPKAMSQRLQGELCFQTEHEFFVVTDFLGEGSFGLLGVTVVDGSSLEGIGSGKVLLGTDLCRATEFGLSMPLDLTTLFASPVETWGARLEALGL